MCCKNEEFKSISYNNRNVFDFFTRSGHPAIMSFRTIDKDIILNDKMGEFCSGDIKKRKQLYSIHELRQAFDEVIGVELEIINRDGTYNIGENIKNTKLTRSEIESCPFRIDMKSEDKEVFIDQLIFDVLFGKYVAECPRMTLRQYSLSYEHFTWSGQKEENLIAESVRKCISTALKKQIAVMNSPELRKEIEKLGVQPDEHFKYMSRVGSSFLNGKNQEIIERPKVEWDYIYYNATTKLITQKQYARSFSTGGNYSRAAFIELFDTYDRFVDEVFMQKMGSGKEYFFKSMDFYFLESYKRLDFIYKLAVRLENTDLPVIDKNSILVKRFHPQVYDVVDQDGSIKFNGSRYMYYRPMLMLEELWQQEGLYNEPMYEDKWVKYYFLRAKIYELFKYHFQFVSDDYDEISDFLDRHYNILGYHEPQKIWIQNDKKRKADREARIIKALEINEALFGDSDKRDPKVWVCDKI